MVTVDRIEDVIASACSLDDEELTARRADWRSLDAVLIESKDRPGGMTARYRGDEPTARALETLVAAERECCPGFDWRLVSEGEEIRLEVTYARLT